MTDRLLSPLGYIVVLVVLLLLTFLTVGLSFVPSSSVMHIVVGQAIAVIKASLVVLFFMHALRERRPDAGGNRHHGFLAGRGNANADVQRLHDAGNDPEHPWTLMSCPLLESSMAAFPRTRIPPTGIGLASTILGAVGLLLFVLPVLSIPLSALGLIFGVVGAILAIIGGWASLRWSVAGIALSSLTLGLCISISQTAGGYLSHPPPPSATWQQPTDRPYVPPPAHPGKFPASTF